MVETRLRGEQKAPRNQVPTWLRDLTVGSRTSLGSSLIGASTLLTVPVAGKRLGVGGVSRQASVTGPVPADSSGGPDKGTVPDKGAR
jgi:hypothetical protein